MFTSITDQLAIGDEMTQEQLNVVAQQGYRTVVDLCTAQEGNTITEAQAREAVNIHEVRNDSKTIVSRAIGPGKLSPGLC